MGHDGGPNTLINTDGKLKLNLYVGDALKMPDDFWDLPYKSRLKCYPPCIEPGS